MFEVRNAIAEPDRRARSGMYVLLWGYVDGRPTLGSGTSVWIAVERAIKRIIQPS